MLQQMPFARVTAAAVVAMAGYSHGHGGLSGLGLGPVELSEEGIAADLSTLLQQRLR